MCSSDLTNHIEYVPLEHIFWLQSGLHQNSDGDALWDCDAVWEPFRVHV